MGQERDAMRVEQRGFDSGLRIKSNNSQCEGDGHDGGLNVLAVILVFAQKYGARHKYLVGDDIVISVEQKNAVNIGGRPRSTELGDPCKSVLTTGVRLPANHIQATAEYAAHSEWNGQPAAAVIWCNACKRISHYYRRVP